MVAGDNYFVEEEEESVGVVKETLMRVRPDDELMLNIAKKALEAMQTEVTGEGLSEASGSSLTEH